MYSFDNNRLKNKKTVNSELALMFVGGCYFQVILANSSIMNTTQVPAVTMNSLVSLNRWQKGTLKMCLRQSVHYLRHHCIADRY